MSDLPEFDRSRVLTYLLVGAVVVVVGIAVLRGQDDGTEVASSSSGGPVVPKVVSRPLTVDVSGAVARPGVYGAEGQQGDRCDRAGRRRDRQRPAGAINRAALLADGQQVVVPIRGSGGSPVAGAASDAPVSLGTATQADLERIDGIGPVTAQRILEFRDSQGGISSVDDLDRISGVGPVTMESLRSALQP